MIDITKAQANQSTTRGVNSVWTITLDGEELYRLPEHFSVQDTFVVRDVVRAMMLRAAADTKAQEQALCAIKIERIVTHGDAKLDQLKAENERLAELLEAHIGE